VFFFPRHRRLATSHSNSRRKLKPRQKKHKLVCRTTRRTKNILKERRSKGRTLFTVYCLQPTKSKLGCLEIKHICSHLIAFFIWLSPPINKLFVKILKKIYSSLPTGLHVPLVCWTQQCTITNNKMILKFDWQIKSKDTTRILLFYNFVDLL